MPELPALPLPAPQVRTRTTRQSPRPRLVGPGASEQQRRLGPELARLTRAFEQGRLAVADEPAALAPEQVLVLEVAGELGTFANAVRKVPGLEFLAEEAEEQLASDELFQAVDYTGRQHRYARQLFLMSSDATAWQQLLGLWGRFQRGEQFPRGLTAFRDLFGRLRSLRAWSDEDRLLRTGALHAWERELADLGDELVDFEIELWLRRDPRRRQQAVESLRADLATVGGELAAESVREEIAYHGLLGRAPATLLMDAVAQHEVRWLRTDYVRFFRATGQIAAVSPDDADSGAPTEPRGPAPAGAPRIALLDGVPLAGHALLANRLVIDDPDRLEAVTPADRRLHGTAMASIVLHGDLDGTSTSQNHPLYVRPILSTQAPDWVREAREELPRDRLAVDLIHEAVVRLYEGDAVAPDVRAIVLAVGDAVAQFDRFVSPLARLLDWLSSRYGVLFLVSGGNHLADLELDADTATDDPRELQHEVLCALQRTAALRRILSPAESANALTIGASHADGSATPDGDDRVDPIVDMSLPNVVSALGPGMRRAIKPDILLPGGRQLLRMEPVIDGRRRYATVPPSRRPPGVRFASPGRRPAELDASAHGTGTSIAAALAGHHAGHLLEAIDALRALHGDAVPGPDFDVVLLKAALAHKASWGTVRALIEDAQQNVLGARSREAVARFVGYGSADPAGALVCDDHRVTGLAAGRIGDGDAHVYRLPFPASLAATTAPRRLTLTLAWLTPINPEHRAYRRAALALEPGAGPRLVTDRADVTTWPSRRGTLQHEQFEGSAAVPFAPGSALELTVSCRADAGALESAVPYAVIATLEAPQELRLPIYEEVRQALRVPVAVRPRT
jgi:hypothetical protein